MRRATFSIALMAMCALTACALPSEPFTLTFNVFPTSQGADVLVDVQGGPSKQAWIGFGVGPGAPAELTGRVHSVEAFDAAGTPLRITLYGQAGYRVQAPGSDWKLGYSLDLRPRAEQGTFYRASTAGDEFLVLVGSDAWARFYETPQPLAYAPPNRPAGFVQQARVNFNLPAAPSTWQVATTAGALTPRSFLLAEHPISSVFGVGPFRMVTSSIAPGLRLAVHKGWNVLRDESPALAATLLAALRKRLTRLDQGTPLVPLTPMPAALVPEQGLRTAGMVRNDTLVLYAATAGGSPSEAGMARLRESMAVFIGHEMFHLYVPSAIPVTRDLSWLSEGWAMHMGSLIAQDAGWLDQAAEEQRLRATYRRYQGIGGYRAGSLPQASRASDSSRDLLYVRGELVFRLLAKEWKEQGHSESFSSALWKALARAHRADTALNSSQVHALMGDLVGADTVRRYVEGQGPLTPTLLGLAGR